MPAPGESSAGKLLANANVQRVPSEKLELFQQRGFLPTDLCHRLIALIDVERRPSTLADDNGDAFFRTSETCDLAQEHPQIAELERRFLALNGIDPSYGEPVQGQRYAVGQEFKPHCDYFTPGGQDWEKYTAVSGQRTWTFMIYLNEPEAGGATRFKCIDKTIKPEAGKLICWNNRRADGSVNPNTLHHGMKVRRGTKYVITKWYREKVWGW